DGAVMPLPLTPDLVPCGVGLAVGASALTLALGYPLPGLLRHLGAGKAVSPYQPAGHQVKSGTPSMAGLLFNGVALVLGAVAVAPFYPDVWLLLALLLACAALGLIDDLSSSLRYRRGGIRARVKLGWLLVVAGIIVALAQLTLHLHVIRVPFAGPLDLGPLYWPVAVPAVA